MKNINVCYYCTLNDLKCFYHFALFWYYFLLFFQPLVLFDRFVKCTESGKGGGGDGRHGMGQGEISAIFKNIQYFV